MFSATFYKLESWYSLRYETGKKLISATPESGSGATTTIERVEHLDGKLVLQGADDGREDVRDGAGWTMSINESTENGDDNYR